MPAGKPPVNWPQQLDEIAFHGLAGEITRAIEPYTEADPVAIQIQLLAAFGNVIGRGPYFLVDGAKHYTNIYAVIVGDTGKARKGTSWAQTRSIVAPVDPGWNQQRIQGNLSSGEGLIWSVRDPMIESVPLKEKGKPTGKYQEVINDPGIGDKRLLVVEAEFASVLKVMGREGSTLSAVIRLAWDTGSLRIMTKNSPAVATDAHITIIGHITLEELRREMTDTEAANGFANRFLWHCVRRPQLLPLGGSVPEDIIAPLRQRLKVAIEFARKAGRMTFDDGARELWIRSYPLLTQAEPGLVGAITARAEAQVIRLACLNALLDGSSTIGCQHLHAAMALWDHCTFSVRYIFGDSTGDAIADTILRGLRNAAPARLTRSEIHDLFGRNVRVARINIALNRLAEAGLARCEQHLPIGGKGRREETWFGISTKETN